MEDNTMDKCVVCTVVATLNEHGECSLCESREKTVAINQPRSKVPLPPEARDIMEPIVRGSFGHEWWRKKR